MKRNEEKTITPKPNNKVNSVVWSALYDDVISRFIVDVDKEAFLLKKHTTKIDTTETGSRTKVMGIYTHVLECYHQAFRWLK
jgi:hypothetical protein